ncbi:MAG: hypothetical protein ACQESR_27600 [Planctomycetota bacterium]
MERCPTPVVLPLGGLAAAKVLRDQYSKRPGPRREADAAEWWFSGTVFRAGPVR